MRIRTLRLAAALAVVFAGPGGPARAVAQQESETARAVERGRRLLKAHIEAMGVPAMQVAVSRGGDLIWSEAFGLADLEDGAPATPLTRFPIASVSKTLTAVAAGILAEEGALDLDAPVRRYVPSFPEKRWPITARQLAQHAGGVRHYRNTVESATAGDKHYEDVVDALEIFAADSLLFMPGTDTRYSSYGYNLLSAVVQSTAGMPFNDFVARRILEPAAMRSTSPAYVDSLIPHRAETYVEREGGGRLRAPVVDPSYKWGSGGYISTAEDLVRFGRALLRGDLVEPRTLDMMWTPGATDRAFGWQILETRDGLRAAYHGGTLPAARAHLLIVPARDLVIAVLANTGQYIAFNDEEFLPLTELFLSDDDAPPTVDPTGRYVFRSTWGDEPTVGWLEIRRQGDDFTGTLSFPFRASPVPVIDVKGRTAHLIAVGGSWMQLWVEFGEDRIRGSWQWGPFEEPITEIRRAEDVFW